MKKVINGALYNTASARVIGSWNNGYSRSDFARADETLYRTKAGKYFLHGEGGGNSVYGVWHGNSGGPGEEIRPYTPDEAREWAEEHLDADAYAAEFGEPDEASEDKESLFLLISADAKRKLNQIKSETGKSFTEIIENFILGA